MVGGGWRIGGPAGGGSCRRLWRVREGAGTAPGGAASAAGSGAGAWCSSGFDASEPLVDAMRQGKIQGLVVQNPLRMGELSVKTMVKHLEKQPVEPKISTGETLVTPENYE